MSHCRRMQDHPPPMLDMTPDGQFRPPPALGWRARIFLVALGISFVTGIIAVVALSFYVLLLLLPIMLALAVFGYVSELWRARNAQRG